MPATGANSFEGLIAALLSQLTCERFYIARSGDQPADAFSSGGKVAIQCKRYNRTPLDETDFEGDFHKACRVFPELDCYVLAATRTTAQVADLADKLQNQTGVDVLVLGFGDDDCELEALCTVFWDVAKHFPKLCELGSSFGAWAATEAQRCSVVHSVDRLRNGLQNSVPIATTVHRKLHSRLEDRFRINTSNNRPSRFRIELPKAIPRRQPQDALWNWWRIKSSRAAAVVGDEGLGKSWIASSFSYDASLKDVLVLWLDSADWAGAQNLEQVVAEGLLQAGFDEKALRDRISRKALSRWRDNMMIVLDGVNEHDAQSTAQRLLSQTHAAQQTPCRLLFTTRPRLWRSDERSLWNVTLQIQASPFSESELSEALSRLSPPVPRSELTPALADIAKIPRYFERATELRRHFETLAVVTKEIVLWAELLEKVESGDPQVVEKIGWESPADVRRALSKLADVARSLSIPNVDGYELLQESFGRRFDQIRNDLAEQRIVLQPGGDNPSPSPEHVILGFAIHLTNLLRTPADDVAKLADLLRRELEPVLSQDHLTEALFVALQLSAFPKPHGLPISSKGRAALLLAWTSSQNSRVYAPRLNFWATHDRDAYIDFAEEVFIEPVSDSWTASISDPLRSIWKHSQGQDVALVTKISEWALFVWRSHDAFDPKELTVDGTRLRVAKSSAQLRLSFVAVAILSEFPLLSFLPTLALAWATDRKSIRRHIFPRQPGTEQQEVHDIGCKDIDNNIGPLLRWRYTETVAPELERLRAGSPSDSAMHKGLTSLIRAFDEFGWISEDSEERIISGARMFDGTPAEFRLAHARSTELAVRDDLPDLCVEDREILYRAMERIFKSNELQSGFWTTRADLEVEMLLPWFAKYHPGALIRLSSEFTASALQKKELGPALSFVNNLPYSPEYSEPGSLLVLAKQAAERERRTSEPKYVWALTQLHLLAFMNFDEDDLLDWLQYAAGHKSLRKQINIWQVVQIAPLVLSDRIAAFAREQVKRFSDQPQSEGDVEIEFDYWATIAATCGPSDEGYNEWVTREIERLKPTGERRFRWVELWFRTATATQIKDAFQSGTMIKLLAERGLRAMFCAGRSVEDWKEVPAIDVTALCQTLALDHVGILLHTAGRISEIQSWGERLFARALSLLGGQPFERRYWGETVLTLDVSGRKIGTSCDEVVSEQSEALRPSERSVFAEDRSADEWERQANDQIKIWREDEQALEAIDPGGFHDFDATVPLQTFRDGNPQRFAFLGRELLNRARAAPDNAFKLGGFVICVTAALVAVDPEFAFSADQALYGRLRVRVTNEYTVSVVHEALWRASAGRNPECVRFAIKLLESAQSDADLMWHSITAQAEGATETLLEICRELSRSPLAKNRCLALSLLAWIPSAAQEIERVAEDSSGWVRTHAKWAAKVLKQEITVRRYYESSLCESETNRLICRLQVMDPALTPSATMWRRQIEEKGPDLTHRNRAAIFLFWYENHRRLEKPPKLFGRDLSEYLRGERISDLHPPKPTLIDSNQDFKYEK